ncbi:isoform 2 [Olea europaea subsp. europaea]|uniref:Isoform 2 n=1 Tax=Olea europaea subsp. europaea TaxID=158383 RepID=A0A8S0SJS9_OLEEU|nr:isoform 2 [Olea europaea subsp. europaea]
MKFKGEKRRGGCKGAFNSNGGFKKSEQGTSSFTMGRPQFCPESAEQKFGSNKFDEGPSTENIVIKLVKELRAPVEYIILPTFAYQHKIFVGPFSRKFPKAQVWVAPRQWSWPLNYHSKM